eukprot:TRINITY_DN8054_c0_g1_i1.p1 TRINITY_DN8054_c0_g1~~TRINITY_DN8054_c0_g1_i1.p1  ORF type:complete len:147 (-),score=42.50 TRINITY_DN8054_c0_g1_i1:63-503(-)
MNTDSELKEAFVLFDKDGGGTITIEEFRNVLTALGHTAHLEQELKDLMNGLDSDKDGQVTFDDFKRVLQDTRVQNTDEIVGRLREAFNMFDTEETGYISAAEFREVLVTMGKKLSHEEVDDMMRTADVKGDGKVSFVEFVQMITGI